MPLYYPHVRLIGRSVTSVGRNSVNGAGDATETQLTVLTIPANTLGTNDFIVIKTIWSHTNSASNKTMVLRFGASGDGTAGTSYHSRTSTTTATHMAETIIGIRGSASQFGGVTGASGGWGPSSGAIPTSTVSLSAATELHFGCNWGAAAASETITLEGYLVMLCRL